MRGGRGDIAAARWCDLARIAQDTRVRGARGARVRSGRSIAREANDATATGVDSARIEPRGWRDLRSIDRRRGMTGQAGAYGGMSAKRTRLIPCAAIFVG
jgi:hypothetical protein